MSYNVWAQNILLLIFFNHKKNLSSGSKLKFEGLDLTHGPQPVLEESEGASGKRKGRQRLPR